MAGAAGVRAGGAFVEIYANDAKFQQAMTRVQGRLKAIGSTMQALGTSMSLVGTALGIPMVLAAKTAAKFEDAMLGMQAAAGLTDGELKAVEKAALDLSRAMNVAPSGIAEAFLELLKAGMSLEQVLGGAGKAAVEFARVSGVEMAEAAVFMKVSMNTFGVSATEAVDTLSAAADASETSIAAMVESFGLVGSAGALFNQSLFDISQGLAVLARFGIKGEEAGTGIKTALMRLTSPAKESEAALAQIGLTVESFRNADGDLLPLVQIVDILEREMVGLDKVMRDRILGQVFGDRGIRVIGAFLNVGVAGFEDIADAMEENLPVAMKFQILMSGITGAMQTMYAAVERLTIAFAKALGPNIAYAAAAAEKFIDIVAALISAFPGVTTAVVGATVALVGMGVVLIATGLAFKALAAGVAVLSAALALLTSPIGIAAAALVAGVAIMLANIYKLSPEFRGEMDAIMAAAMSLDFGTAWQLMNINLAIALVEMQQRFHDTFSAVKNTVMGVSDWIGDKLIEGLDRFLGLFGSDILWLQGNLEKLGKYFKAAFDWDFALNGLTDALAAVDARIEKERAKAPNADARAQERDAERDRRAKARQAADDEAQKNRPGTIDELKAERERIKKRGEENRKKADELRKNEAKRGDLEMPMMDAAAGGVTAKSVGTFSAALAGRIGVGPEIQVMNAIADNTGRAADALEGMLQGNFKNANPLGDINAVNGAIAAAARVQTAPVAGGDEALVTPMEQTAASVAESTRHLRELVGLARSGGLAFA
jgi:TP901 family phage tail tape measure protein